MNTFDAAIAALKKNDLDTALTELISLWRTTRSTALGDVIDQLSAKVPAQRPPIEGRTRGDQLAQWFARAKKRDAGDLTMLLNSMFDFSAETARERLMAIERYGFDPRLTVPLMRWFATIPRGYQGIRMVAFWGRITGILEKVKDPRVARDAVALRDGWREDDSFAGRRDFARWSGELVTASARWKAKEQSVDLSPLLPWLDGAKPPSARQGVTEALDAVYRNPEDLGLRQVCAEVLTESGDVRGEFITLELAGRLKPPQRKRHATLLKQLGASMLGPLAAVVSPRELRFQNGFPVAAALEVQRRDTDENNHAIREKTLGLPNWSTFEVLGVSGWEDPVRPLIEAESMRSLKALHFADASIFGVTRPLRLETLTVIGSSTADIHDPFLTGASAHALKHLHFRPAGERALDALWSSPVLRRLESLGISTNVPSERLTELLPLLPENVRTLIIVNDWPRYQMRFEREGVRWRGSIGSYSRTTSVSGPFNARCAEMKRLLPTVDVEPEERVVRAVKL